MDASTSTPSSRTAYWNSPIGTIEIVGNDDGIAAVNFIGPREQESEPTDAEIRDCIRQLDEYFRGVRQEFSLRLAAAGTDFERKVWNELTRIPFGETRSYLDIARILGDPGAVRAVGRANGSNPLAIVVPCHRVVGHDGSLTGYAGGIERKRWLLDHEAVVSGTRLAL
jgi:methylated-DNA-[protein]-cysteine S-methyltransferase